MPAPCVACWPATPIALTPGPRMRMWNGKPDAWVSLVAVDRSPRPQVSRRGGEGRSGMRRSGAAHWTTLRDARLRPAPQDEVRGAGLLLCVVFAALIALLPVPTAAANDSTQAVSPD